MYGAKFSKSYGGSAQPTAHEIGANSEEFNIGDLVCWASGYLEVVDHATSDRPIGICKQKVTMASDNQTSAKVKVPYIPLNEMDEFEMDFDATATQANVGQFFQLNTGGTGAQTVDLGSASDTVGQLLCTAFDPRDEGSSTRGRFRVALPEMAFEPET